MDTNMRAHCAVDGAPCAENCAARRVYMSGTTFFLNELKLKMAVDAGRKWLPREKVMPGKPGGDDGDAHAAGQSGSSPLAGPRLPAPAQRPGAALPPTGVRGVLQVSARAPGASRLPDFWALSQ